MFVNDSVAVDRVDTSIRETKMNKKELVGALADQCGTTQAQAGEFVNAFCEIMLLNSS